jgi:hypothetical protein
MTFTCLDKKEDDGYMRDNANIHDVAEAITELLAKSQGVYSVGDVYTRAKPDRKAGTLE